MFEREPILAEARGLKESFRAIYRAADRAEAERRLEAFLAAVDRACLPAFDAFAKGIRIWRCELLAYFDEPTTNGDAEGVINKVKVIMTPRLRQPPPSPPPPARASSMRLTGSRGVAPLDRRETEYSTGADSSRPV